MKLNLRKLRHERKWTIDDLADASGLSRGFISQLENGRRLPGPDTITLLCDVFGVSVSELIEGASVDSGMVAVAGRVGAGARVPLVDAYEKGAGLYHVIRPPQLAREKVVAVEVEGDSMAPMYQPGHVLFFTRVTTHGIPEEDIGHPCVVEDDAGMAWVKVVRRGDEAGHWNLVSLNHNADTVWNVPIRWAARVRFALPAEFVERVDEA